MEKLEILTISFIAILFLAVLVWMMYKEGSKASWQATSRQTREQRDKNEKQK
ncbi:MAG: hypothetical protein WC492_00315 [Candidatus Micrarchaeia archaeon]